MTRNQDESSKTPSGFARFQPMGFFPPTSGPWRFTTRKTYSATFGSAPKARDARDESPGPGAYGQNFSVRVLSWFWWFLVEGFWMVIAVIGVVGDVIDLLFSY